MREICFFRRSNWVDLLQLSFRNNVSIVVYFRKIFLWGCVFAGMETVIVGFLDVFLAKSRHASIRIPNNAMKQTTLNLHPLCFLRSCWCVHVTYRVATNISDESKHRTSCTCTLWCWFAAALSVCPEGWLSVHSRPIFMHICSNSNLHVTSA